MRVSAATGAVDFGIANNFFQRVFDRALGGRSPVRRWQPPTEPSSDLNRGDGGTLGFVGALMAGLGGTGSSVAVDAV